MLYKPSLLCYNFENVATARRLGSVEPERLEILSAEIFLDSFGAKTETFDTDVELERDSKGLQASRRCGHRGRWRTRRS